ncbi:uncharacterized protein F4822DRAFT_430158 [Hypoxylon trugodes]|uniref:uncharacterized protein n=1 Tax=Hypoxylon trugodes TaxID=326681 RepID=UPI00219B9919|nr:uncharacterized protein F4822DRAFT_430158 [Hypoxylon trugodes]KAI1387412.1 hypothetical protein F4822DRAFT_430158 [Hypoxylon trugodes]
MPQTSAPTPSLLLTKRLTAFLNSNLSPQLHTAALTTPSGKLLAHASSPPNPVGALRTQCTVAASLWAHYAASTDTVINTLPPPQQQYQFEQRYLSGGDPASGPSAVTVQLAGGVLVIRRLKCGLLFVCIGPAGGAGGAEDLAQSQTRTQGVGPVPVSGAQQQQAAGNNEAHGATTPLGSPSEVESVASAGAATTASIATTNSIAATAVVATRRQAEELARWLDDKLGSLGVLEEGLGIETR